MSSKRLRLISGVGLDAEIRSGVLPAGLSFVIGTGKVVVHHHSASSGSPLAGAIVRPGPVSMLELLGKGIKSTEVDFSR